MWHARRAPQENCQKPNISATVLFQVTSCLKSVKLMSISLVCFPFYQYYETANNTMKTTLAILKQTQG